MATLRRVTSLLIAVLALLSLEAAAEQERNPYGVATAGECAGEIPRRPSALFNPADVAAGGSQAPSSQASAFSRGPCDQPGSGCLGVVRVPLAIRQPPPRSVRPPHGRKH